MTDLQMDIFDNAVPVEEIETKKPGRQETIKGRWRRMYGIDESHRCKDCRYLCRYQSGNFSGYKCNLMGISASEATDIRLKDVACKRWESGD